MGKQLDKVYDEFRNPGAEYRAKPFWAWNDRLEAEEIRRQIRVFQEMGFGGYFMHSRVGLKTRYLGEDWFRMIEAGIDEGRQTGMEAWLYDEDRWPSGLAGGLVTRDPRWRMKRLDCLRVKAEEVPTDALAVFQARFDDAGRLIAYERVQPGASAAGIRADEAAVGSAGGEAQAGDGNGSVMERSGEAKAAVGDGGEWLAFRVVQGFTDSFYNGYTYLDTLSKEAVREFLNVTYEPYAERFAEEFGRTIPGVFTDEPNRGHILAKWKPSEHNYQIPWTAGLEAEFEQRLGYDLLERLPEIFYDRPDAERLSKIRADFAECVNQLYVEAFAVQVGQWCEEHNLLLTGHILHENTLGAQMATSGSHARFYEHMQAPGMDILRHSVHYIVPKQVQSVARQLGKKWVLSEMYANHGWEFPLEGYKTYGDWQAVLGVNLRCPHLSLYSMAGQRKRDCPPTISFHQPWHKDYRMVEDYFARVHRFTMQGEPVCDLLIVHPIEALGGMIRPGWTQALMATQDKAIKALETAFDSLTRWLLGRQVDFDYGDEEHLARLARVEAGAAGPEVVLGEMRYRRLLVPPMPNLRASTLALLASFAAQGGEVVWLGDAATHVDWAASGGAAELAGKTRRLPLDEAAFAAHYRRDRPVAVSLADGADATDVFAQLRREDDAAWLMLAHVNTELAAGVVTVKVAGTGQVQEWDPVTASRTVVAARSEGGVTEFATSLEAGQSRLFAIVAEADAALPLQTSVRETAQIPATAGEYAVTLDEPNALVLDCPRYRLGDGEWQESRHILDVDLAIRSQLGLEERSNTMIQPWYREEYLQEETAALPTASLELAYEFGVAYLPGADIELALEQAERFRVTVNGQPLELAQDNGWWVDPCLRRFTVPRTLLREGSNELVLETTFEQSSDLEAVFLLGEFGVRLKGERSIMEVPVTRLQLGDWTKQGLPFYGGCVRYSVNFEADRASAAPTSPDAPSADSAAYLVVPGYDGICVRVHEQAVHLGTIAWWPYELALPADNNGNANRTLDIEVVGSRANANGPNRKRNSRAWQLVPAGLTAAPYLSVRRAERD